MKTLRNFLLERHHAANPKLDLIREGVLNRELRAAGVAESKTADTAAFPLQWLTIFRREILLPFRWHLAGMSAVWLVTVILNLDPSPAATTNLAKQNSPSPRQILTSLRENRRQITELLEPSASVGGPVAKPPTFVPKRRSEISSPYEMV